MLFNRFSLDFILKVFPASSAFFFSLSSYLLTLSIEPFIDRINFNLSTFHSIYRSMKMVSLFYLIIFSLLSLSLSLHKHFHLHWLFNLIRPLIALGLTLSVQLQFNFRPEKLLLSTSF